MIDKIEKKQKAFFWGNLIAFYAEMYLTLSFAAGINITYLSFTNPLTCFNTVLDIITMALLVICPIIIAANVANTMVKNEQQAKAEVQAET